MKRPALLLVALASAATIPAACDGAGAGGGSLRLEVAVSPTPALVGPVQVRVRVRDSLDAPVSGARVVLEGVPPGGAHGGAVTDTAVEARAGLWVADSFPLGAPGEWTLDATAELPDGRRGRRTHPLRVVAPAGGSGG